MSTSTATSALQADSPFLVLNASAGSGKTYSLVQHILLSALRPASMSNAYQRILAITFTNNAAEEMKTRLLQELMEFSELSNPEKSTFFEPIWTTIGLTPAQLQARATAAAKHMLHNYSTLNVGTIDQFTHRLVRTFTKDLDLGDNFEVRLDLRAMVAEALDELYSTLGDRPDLKATFLALAQDRMNRGSRFDPDHELKKQGEASFNENLWDILKQMPEPARMLEIEKELKKELYELIGRAKEFSKKARSILQDYGATTANFSYLDNANNNLVKGWGNLHKNDFVLGTNTLKSKAKKGHAEVEGWEELKEEVEAFYHAYERRFKLLKIATAKLQELAATKALLAKFDALEKEQNTLPISRFNQLISEELQREPTAFIYARLGEKFWHFYIDEFQDTSTLQFSNMHPLIEHTLTKDEHPNSALIVGDAKQSIYRWRGGRAEQFMSLIDGSDVSNRFEQHPDGHELYPRETVQLATNFRTHGAIVNFNNHYFSSLTHLLSDPQHKAVYHYDRVAQSPNKSEDQGVVRIDLIGDANDPQSGEDLKALVCESTLARIQELVDEGNSLGDIALLVRSNEQGRTLANFLTQHHIPVLSVDALTLGNAHESRLLLAASKLYLNPSDGTARFDLAHALAQLNALPSGVEAFAFERDVVHRGLVALIQPFPKAAKLLSHSDSLFHFAVRLFDSFGLLEAPNMAVDAVLDLIFSFQTNDGTLATLPAWWAEKSAKYNLSVPSSDPAVSIMTVHKAKGLQFDHVIVPFHLKYEAKTESHWVPSDLHEELPYLPISHSSKNENLFSSADFARINNENYFDAINVAYVAMTRPVRGLHLLLTAFTSKSSTDTFRQSLLEYAEMEPGQSSWQVGNPVPPASTPSPDRPNPEPVSVGSFRAEQMRIAKTAPENWHKGETDARSWGTALHRVLQLPESMREAALQRLYRSGAFSSALHERAAHVLDAMKAEPELAPLEDADTVVYIERTVLSNDETLRPDLIIQTATSAFVIDYKTGLPKTKDEAQIAHYTQQLEHSLGKVEGKLLYI